MSLSEKDLPYPVVVKPLDSSGSKGVTLLRSYDAGRLILAYQHAVSYSLSGKARTEEYIFYGYRHLIDGDVMRYHSPWFHGLSQGRVAEPCPL